MAAMGSSGLFRWLGVLKLSGRQLQQRWLESLLIVLGIGLGVGVLTTGETFVRFQDRMTVELVAGQIREWEAVTVQPFTRSVGEALIGPDGVPAVRVSLDDVEDPVRFTMADLIAMRTDIPGVQYVTVQAGTRGLPVVAVDDGLPDRDEARETALLNPQGQQGQSVNLEMVTPDEFGVLGYEFAAGGPFTWDDFYAEEPRIVLERGGAEQLFPGLRAEDVVGRTVTTSGFSPSGEGHRWVVVGVIEFPEHVKMMLGLAFESDESRRGAFGYGPATVDTGRSIRISDDGLPRADDQSQWETNRMYLSPVDEERIPDIVAEAQLYLDQKYGPGRVELRNPLAERASSFEGAGPVIVALLVLAGLGLIIAAVNVLNLFTSRVLRRLRITGMSVALGATRRLLFWQTAAEALLLGAAGSVLGIGVASGFVSLIRRLLMMQVEGGLPTGTDVFGGLKVGLVDAGIGIALGAGLSLIFGLYPAWLGSRQNPVEALRVE